MNAKKISIFVFIILVMFFRSKAQDTLTLQQAIEISLKNNYSLSIARNDFEIATNNNNIGNAGMLPKVTISGSQNNNIYDIHQKYQTGETNNLSGAKSNSLNAGIVLDWTIFDGFNMFVSKQKYSELEKMSQVQLKIVVQRTVARVMNLYSSIIQQEKMIQVTLDALKISTERKKIAGEKIKFGSGSQSIYLQAVVDLNADSSKLIQQQAALQTLKSSLNEILARDPSVLYSVTGNLNINNQLIRDSLWIKTEKENPGLLLAEYARNISDISVREYEANWYPKIGVYAGYNFAQSNSEYSTLKSSQTTGPNFGVNASWTIFNGLKNTNNLKNAKIRRENSQLSYDEQILALKTDFYLYFNDYETNLMLIKLESSNVEAARQNVQFAFEKYKLGALSDIDLRTIQLKLIDAEYRLLNAQYKAKIDEIEILAISGGLTL